jgi:hypothetical protein
MAKLFNCQMFKNQFMRAIIPAFALPILCTVIVSSNTGTAKKEEHTMSTTDTIVNEMKKIDSLLQDKSFAESIAAELEASYYKGVGEVAPPFLKPGEDSLLVEKSVREEKIATNAAGFYALECGINYLCTWDSSTPADWIEKIASGKMADEKDAIEILDRFANATWKAGQPFRSLDRIKKTNFIGWSGLSTDEIKKDYRQIVGAATKLQPLIKGTKDEQQQQLKKLLQSKDFALEIAAFMDSSYNAGENKPVPAFISKEEETATKKKSFKEEKIAMNVAGFYALECGLNYFVAAKKIKPSIILQSIADNSISKEDKLLFCRFANATWKAGQPFRSLDRVTRETFTPFNFLSEADVEKDWVQVKAAAVKLKTALL